MSATPPNPFLLTRQARWTPSFQTTNGDGVLGDDGVALGTFNFVGHVLWLELYFVVGTLGAGTGDLLLPMPPGYTSNDIDGAAALGVESEGTQNFNCEAVQAIVSVPPATVGSAVEANVFGTQPGDPAVIQIAAHSLPFSTPGETMYFRFALPMKEPALPG